MTPHHEAKRAPTRKPAALWTPQSPTPAPSPLLSSLSVCRRSARSTSTWASSGLIPLSPRPEAFHSPGRNSQSLPSTAHRLAIDKGRVLTGWQWGRRKKAAVFGLCTAEFLRGSAPVGFEGAAPRIDAFAHPTDRAYSVVAITELDGAFAAQVGTRMFPLSQFAQVRISSKARG
jgi:hypothetical protein